MTEDILTGFTDKNGKPIHIDDTVQFRLNNFGKTKSGGTSQLRVIRASKKKFALVQGNGGGGFYLRQDSTQYITIIDCPHSGKII